MSQNKPLKFAVLVDSNLLKKWQLDCIQHLIEHQVGSLQTFIKNSETSVYQKSNLSLGFRYLERKVRNKGPLKVIDINQHFPEAKSMLIQAQTKGKAAYFKKEDIEKVQSLQLDFILRFGFGIIRGEILNVPQYGIWSFHHGDPKKYRGGPPGLWEIMKGDPINGAILQRLTNKLDGGYLLKEGFFKTTLHSYADNLFQLLEESKHWPTQVAKSIILDAERKLKSELIETSASIYKAPSSPKVMQLLILQLRHKIKFHIQDLFRAEKWNVGTINMPVESLLEEDISNIDWLKEAGANSYFADPFTDVEDPTRILVEHYNYKKQQGKISVLSSASKNQDILHLESHLSYPFTFELEGKSYVLPESYESNAIQLYELKNGKATSPITLLEGKWLDPTLIFDKRYWWLFCTHKKRSNEKLFLFHSKSLEGPYSPHPLNPIVTDIKSARPAGKPFQKEGVWYRLGQNSSKTYGGSVQIKKIETLSPTQYEESFVREIFPLKNSTYNKGLHTISPFGEQTLIDGKRYYFNIFHFYYQLQFKLKRLFKQ